ncbi:MAG TPA: hypothetical protein VND83_04020 [Acidimicrobiales bacterium]|nr:hypothetical protein [Acidimicrobiales bacterium]
MVLVIIGLLWVALLAPVAIRRLRDRGGERSIESFHMEHEVLSHRGYTVSPAHRLSEPEPERAVVDPRSSRLTVVHAGDTYGTLETRRSWEEWSEDYDYERHEPVERAEPLNRYASAYASVPREAQAYERYEPVVRRRSMRAQRRLIITALVSAVVVMTSLALLAGSSLLVDGAILTWVAFAGYAALALYAISQGWLDETSLWSGRSRSRTITSVEPLYDDTYDDGYDGGYGGTVTGLVDARYDDAETDGWRRESRFALG